MLAPSVAVHPKLKPVGRCLSNKALYENCRRSVASQDRFVVTFAGNLPVRDKMQAARNSTIFNDLLTLAWGATILFVSPVNGAQAAKQNEVVAYVSVMAAKEEVLQSRTIGFGKVQSRPADVISVDAPIDSIVSKVYVRPGESAKQGSSLVDLTTAATTQDAYHTAQTAVGFENDKLKRRGFLRTKRDCRTIAGASRGCPGTSTSKPTSRAQMRMRK